MSIAYDVICVGNTTLDAFFTLPKEHPQYTIDKNTYTVSFPFGGKVNIESCDFSLGGNAANVAVGLSRLGIKATLCAEIGDDEFALKIVNSLAKEGIDRGLIKQTKSTPSSFAVALNFGAERTIFVKHIERKHDFHLENVTASWVYLTSLGQRWEEPYQKILSFVKEHQATLAFNPGSLQLDHPTDEVRQVLEKSDYLFVNKEEAKILLKSYTQGEWEKEKNISENDLLTALHMLGSKNVIITDSIHGSFALDADGNFSTYGIIHAPVIEKTGAGDAYASGFLASRIKGRSISESMTWGANNAASVIQQIGAQKGLLNLSAFEKNRP